MTIMPTSRPIGIGLCIGGSFYQNVGIIIAYTFQKYR